MIYSTKHSQTNYLPYNCKDLESEINPNVSVQIINDVEIIVMGDKNPNKPPKKKKKKKQLIVEAPPVKKPRKKNRKKSE